jgi:hypothetical protein
MKTHYLENGGVAFEYTHNVDNIIEGVKEQSELITRSHRNRAGALYLGSIDALTAANWSKECGAAIGTKAFAKYAKKKLMDPDNAKFRAQRILN